MYALAFDLVVSQHASASPERYAAGLYGNRCCSWGARLSPCPGFALMLPTREDMANLFLAIQFLKRSRSMVGVRA